MKREIFLTTFFVVVGLFDRSLSVETDQCQTGAALPTLGAPTIANIFSCNTPAHTCPTAGDLYCGTGTECLAAYWWCDGTADGTTDCTTGMVDEGILAGQYCHVGACTGCTALKDLAPAAFTNSACQPVIWDPPKSARSEDVMIADCNHFPGTTFNLNEMTEVVYTLDVGGLTPHRYCIFEVAMPAGPCDPPVNNCPNTAQTKTADVGETTAKVTWTEITTDATATAAIDNESHRPGSMFPLGYTRVEYTITKTTDTSMKSYCIFYVNVKASSSTPSSLDCDWLEPITKIITPPTLSASVQTELDALLSQVPASVTKTMSTLTTDFLFPLGSNEFHVILEDNGEGIVCPTTILITYPADNSNPVISNCPEDSVDVCYSNGVTIVSGTWTEPIATDDVAVKSFTSNIKPGTFLTIPSALDPPVTVEYKAVDYADKTTQCSFNLNFVVC